MDGWAERNILTWFKVLPDVLERPPFEPSRLGSLPAQGQIRPLPGQLVAHPSQPVNPKIKFMSMKNGLAV